MAAPTEYVDAVYPVVEILSDIHGRGYSRNRVFSDWLDLMVTTLQHDDEAYLEVCNQYDNEDIEQFAAAFGEVQQAMSEVNNELLGVIYEHLGQNSDALGQHFTPHNVCAAKAEMAGVVNTDTTESDEPLSVGDPACGSGRLLVAAAKQIPSNTEAVFHGVDKDSVCAKMTALNLVFFNMDGVAIHGDSLTGDVYRGWKTTSTPLGGEIVEIPDDSINEYYPASMTDRDSEKAQQKDQPKQTVSSEQPGKKTATDAEGGGSQQSQSDITMF